MKPRGEKFNELRPVIDAFLQIGYKRDLIRTNYEFADFYEDSSLSRHIDLGVFGQEPLNYRSACFGIHFKRERKTDSRTINAFRALGAPVVFLVENGVTRSWRNTGKALVPKEEFRTDQLPGVILANEDIWNPDEMIRVKSGFKRPGPRQLDFIDAGLLPALELEASTKIDEIIRTILHSTEREFKKRKLSFKSRDVFRIFFRLLTGKLIRDHGVSGASQIDFSDPEITLSHVSRYYGNGEKPHTGKIPKDILRSISGRIGGMFSLKNISVDTLTYIYENTFVSEKSRRKMGIHSTPPHVADYVMNHLPIEDLPRSRWSFLDPTCGHGIFLIAAMRRMRDLLPASWNGGRRHGFFMKRLHGIEIDAFSVEVARMCLMLADFPESNGWDLVHADAFSGQTLASMASEASIIVGNPPFEKLRIQGRQIPKPIHLLQKILPNLREGSLFGMVLPRSLIDSVDYRDVRVEFLKKFNILSLTTLPERVFLHSKAETVIVIAKKNKGKKKTSTVYREVKDYHKNIFRKRNEVTWEDKIHQSYFSTRQGGRLVLPMMNELWERLERAPRLEEIAIIKKGVEYEPDEVKGRKKQIIQNKPFKGSRAGVSNITDGFQTFAAKDTVYMATAERLMRRKAWILDWDLPKVVVPISPTSMGPWPYAAAIDRGKRLFSRRFYAIWPQNINISIESIAAILNSPLAQAYTYIHCSKRDIPARIYKSIPIPKKISDADLLIVSLVNAYLKSLETNPGKAKNILLRIDAEILKLYNLPADLERRLLDLFWGDDRRRVPFEFRGYIPPENASWIPLHVHISTQYQQATPKKILADAPDHPDNGMLKYIDKIWREIP